MHFCLAFLQLLQFYVNLALSRSLHKINKEEEVDRAYRVFFFLQ